MCPQVVYNHFKRNYFLKKNFTITVYRITIIIRLKLCRCKLFSSYSQVLKYKSTRKHLQYQHLQKFLISVRCTQLIYWSWCMYECNSDKLVAGGQKSSIISDGQDPILARVRYQHFYELESNWKIYGSLIKYLAPSTN